MKRAIVLSLWLALLFLQRSYAQTLVTIGSTNVYIDTLYTGLDVPWEIIYHEEYVWVTERKGLVSRISQNKVKTTVLDITGEVYQQSESGLLGMAFKPSFSPIQEVFLVYTFGSAGNIWERLVKYNFNGTQLINPQILIDSIPGNSTHNGSRLAFMPDGTLLMSTGDAQNTALSQDTASLNGKILRLNTDGSIPADNPIPGSYVYTWGHRNMQGLTAANGFIYASEHGASSDDEIQLIYPGRNYGWPAVQGYCDQPQEITFCNANNVAEPIRTWTPTIAPAGIEYYENAEFPEFDKSLLLAVLKDKRLLVLKLNPAGDAIISESSYFVNQFGRIRDITVGYFGEIYLATNGPLSANTEPNTHSIICIRPPKAIGLNEANTAKEMFVYPNPSGGVLYLNDAAQVQPDRVEIRDMQGRICMRTGFSSGMLDASELAAGMYILQAYKGNRSVLLQKICLR